MPPTRPRETFRLATPPCCPSMCGTHTTTPPRAGCLAASSRRTRQRRETPRGSLRGSSRAPPQRRRCEGGARDDPRRDPRSEEHTSELQSPCNLVCRLLLEKKKPQIPRASLGPASRP